MLDAEEMAHLVAEYHATAAQEARRRGGDVVRVARKREEPDRQVEVGLSEQEAKALARVADVFHRVCDHDERVPVVGEEVALAREEQTNTFARSWIPKAHTRTRGRVAAPPATNESGPGAHLGLCAWMSFSALGVSICGP
eukprot:4782705-Prymnesium_polylepis.1